MKKVLLLLSASLMMTSLMVHAQSPNQATIRNNIQSNLPANLAPTFNLSNGQTTLMVPVAQTPAHVSAPITVTGGQLVIPSPTGNKSIPLPESCKGALSQGETLTISGTFNPANGGEILNFSCIRQ